MNQKEVFSLQQDITKIFNEVKLKHPSTEEILKEKEQKLKEKYFSKQNEKKDKKDRYEEIKKFMVRRLGEPQQNVTVNNEEDLTNKDKPIEVKIENAKNLIKAINFSKTVGIRYNFLLGDILYQIQNDNKKMYRDFVKNIDYNADYCRFLIKFYKLLSVYKKLQHINLPLRYFKTNYFIIKDICKENQEEWK